MALGSLLVRCPSCQAKNRLPLTRVGQTGRCGRCRGDLPGDAFYAEQPVAVDDARFDLVTRRSRLPVLVDFWAAGCQPCHQMEPILEELARDLSQRLLVVKVDAAQAMTTAARFGIRAVPTLVVLRSGLEVDRLTGALPLAALRSRIERFL